ncbi:MAG TPA: hypothetical protein VEL05_12100 [Candidatus Acidoferrum sp.]|nr:hypothetical protein [Candidatus Acidoferrum sp.]
MDERDRLAELLAELAAEFPGFRIISKPSSRMQRMLHRALVVLTLGRNRAYLDGFHTTIGRRVYVTSDWDEMGRDQRYLVLRHERVHLRQFRRYTLGGMALLYLLVPLPFGLAYFRARFERAAYEETIRGTAELHGAAHVAQAKFRDRILDQFTGPAYGWMWPFRRSLERWYERVLAGIGRTGV